MACDLLYFPLSLPMAEVEPVSSLSGSFGYYLLTGLKRDSGFSTTAVFYYLSLDNQ